MHTTSTIANAAPLTAAAMLDAIREVKQRLRTAYYMTSEHVERGKFYQLPNEDAPLGYDFVCHPDDVGEMQARATGYTLIPMGAAEWQRRTQRMAARLRPGG